MRLRIKNIRERQKLAEKRFRHFAGHPHPVEEDPVGQLDVDELLEEEHPLMAWVETRAEVDVALFDPDDRSWAEGELDGVEARDPEFRVPAPIEPSTTQPEPARHSATLPETPRLIASQPVLRKSASLIEYPKTTKPKKGVASGALGALKNVYSRASVPQPNEPAKETDSQRLGRRRRKLTKGTGTRPVGSDDSTQAPSDSTQAPSGPSDDDAAAAGATSGAGHMAPTYSLGLGLFGHTEGGGDEEETRQTQGGQDYQGQQRQAGLDWGNEYGGYGSSYQPYFQPSYSEPSGGYSYSDESSIQVSSRSPRSQFNLEDIAQSLFGFDYGAMMRIQYEDENSIAQFSPGSYS